MTKRFGPFPAAHRQHKHSGHCKLVHGHNWSFDITLCCFEHQLDENVFVFDFGGLRSVKYELECRFDHTLLIVEDDPELPLFREHCSKLWDLRVIPLKYGGSAEGLAHWIFDYLVEWFFKKTEGRVKVQSVTCFEDDKNSATWSVVHA